MNNFLVARINKNNLKKVLNVLKIKVAILILASVLKLWVPFQKHLIRFQGMLRLSTKDMQISSDCGEF